MTTDHITSGPLFSFGLVCLLLFQPVVIPLTPSLSSTYQKKHLTSLLTHTYPPSTLKNAKVHTDGSPHHAIPSRETLLCHHEYFHPYYSPPLTPSRISYPKGQAPTHKYGHEDDPISANATESSITYWVDAGSNGDGIKEGNPSGNISYVLNNLVSPSTYDTIKVMPGVYNHTMESFPLHVDTAHVTLTSTAGASVTIINGTGNTTGIWVSASNITINGFTIKNCGGKLQDASVYLNGASETVIADNTIINNLDGVFLEDSSETVIAGNTLIHNIGASIQLLRSSIKNLVTNNTITNTSEGITLTYSSANTIMCNTITNTEAGIQLWDSFNTTVVGNTITNNTYTGIYLDNSSANTIMCNTITNTEAGIYLLYSNETTIYGNTMVQCGIMLWGHKATFTTQLIAENNTVNGRPVYYYTNQDMRGASVPSDAGQVILGNVTHLTIEDVNVSSGSVGVFLAYSSYITLTDAIITTNTYDGIRLWFSNETTITSNTITNNLWHGIRLFFSSETTITTNIVTNNEAGIVLDDSTYNTITGNNITNNTEIGMLLSGPSTDNLVYRNNVLGNDVNAMDSGGGNAFNTSTIGNYWGDYNGTDANGDGIGDTPYEIPGLAESKDYYPAMKPFAILPPPEEPQGEHRLRFVVPVVILAVGIVLGFLLLRYGGALARLSPFMHDAQLKGIITTITASLQRLWTDRDRQTLNVQNVLEATVDELGTRLEEPVEKEDKLGLINLVRNAFYLLGKRFDVTWKETWTVNEYMSKLIERADPAYASLLREGYRHYEELLYAERKEWREALQAIHHVLVKMTEKL